MTIDFAKNKAYIDANRLKTHELVMAVEALFEQDSKTPDLVRRALRLLDVAGDVADLISDVRGGLYMVEAQPTETEEKANRLQEICDAIATVQKIRDTLDAFPELAVMATQLVDEHERLCQGLRRTTLAAFGQDADTVYPMPPSFSLNDWLIAAEAEMRSALGGEARS